MQPQRHKDEWPPQGRGLAAPLEQETLSPPPGGVVPGTHRRQDGLTEVTRSNQWTACQREFEVLKPRPGQAGLKRGEKMQETKAQEAWRSIQRPKTGLMRIPRPGIWGSQENQEPKLLTA